MTDADAIITLLASIDASLRELVAFSRARQNKQTTSNDRLCDGPHGDPVIKAKDPRDWTGDSMQGRKMSECPPEYLEMLAERLDYFASKEEDPKKQKYNVLDANRARAWAARKRNGWTAPAVAQSEGEPQW